MGEESLSPEELEALMSSADLIDENGNTDEGKGIAPEASADTGSTDISTDKSATAVMDSSATTHEEENDSEDDSNKEQQNKNIQLLLDIYMQVTVELGRTNMKIKDILSLGEGSIIELDKPAGEPVELLVNNRLVAKGEVVVIDENFGVRVTEIIDPKDRLFRMTA